jgi:hypothetical protein
MTKGSIRLGVAAMVLAGGAQAGVLMEWSRQTLATGAVTDTDRFYVQQGMARMEAANGQRATIFKDDAMFELDKATKTYMVIDQAAMSQMAGHLNQAYAQMQQRMAGMPPEQRAQMEKMMSQLGGKGAGPAAAKAHETSVVDLGVSSSAAGRSCHLWNKTRDGVPDAQLCVVAAGSLPGSDEVVALMKKLSAFTAAFQEAMRAQGGPLARMGESFAGRGIQEYDLMQKVNGVPIVSRQFDSAGKLAADEHVLTKWQAQSIPASQFEIPADYTRRSPLGKGEADKAGQ